MEPQQSEERGLDGDECPQHVESSWKLGHDSKMVRDPIWWAAVWHHLSWLAEGSSPPYHGEEKGDRWDCDKCLGIRLLAAKDKTFTSLLWTLLLASWLANTPQCGKIENYQISLVALHLLRLWDFLYSNTSVWPARTQQYGKVKGHIKLL